ncbi:response regulator [Aureimonas phyllosphaerae]|uniref:Two-component system phosphate regulon response regulator OmpR n=1 Tax=Aureimonas phyllosphaerae TaxID=1166078 RepID=A0A7W6FV91_9HYPH|nr:response regulator transcription factor [Aureimonas phyllosphaerae]MBB3935792.1 two-component system phosphate regulon response regulator OmpR [Aureimonas phyllosphaerae]MBB3959800.1 two-component system phosphate regulon response regulator OmpR [Aureimonas phyllosphaerae]SFF15165.1 two-component system, OmpR family, phosphate regulon response regulator OmpR [Aureimonas phyllosphaerae]
MTLAEDHATDESMDDAPHLLIIDDDRRIRSLLSRFLSERRFRVSVASDAAEARRILQGLEFDLMIVDVMMPGESGLDLVRSVSPHRDIPILMLTARSETDDRILGLEAGADDYLAKPFDPRELLLRINNILKRGGTTPVQKVEHVRFGPFSFSLSRKELRRGADVIRLTEREQEIMTQFAQKAGDTIPRQDLLTNDTEVGERTVDVQINRLRRKIESDPANPLWLQTVRGIGYRLNVD